MAMLAYINRAMKRSLSDNLWAGYYRTIHDDIPHTDLVNRPWYRLLSPLDDSDELRLRKPLVREI